MMTRIISLILMVVLVIFFTNCATVTAPTGGPKDQLPPKLINSSTQNFSTNFDASAIILTFNEFIKLSNPSQNIHTSPPLGKKVAYTTTKNKLFITFKEALEENLTYHINFGKSIQDVNEGNPLNNFQFIFSTGDQIDSMSIQGKLMPVNEIKIDQNTLVGLYRNIDDDSIFYKEAPFYYTYVDDAGSFSFRNIKNGTYQIRALSDANGNRYFDLPNESIGFLKDPIQLDSNIFNVEIFLFKAENPKRRVVDFTNNISDYTSTYVLSDEVATKDLIEFEFISDSLKINGIKNIEEDGKTIQVFFDKTLNSITQLNTVLKINGAVVDSLQQTVSNLKSPQQEFSITEENLLVFDTLRLNSIVPIASYCENILIIDTLNRDTLPFLIDKVVDNQLFINLGSKLLQDHVYTLLIKDSCLIDVLGNINKEFEAHFKIESTDERGMLNLIFEEVDSTKNYLVSFLNAQKNILRKKIISSEQKNWHFENLSVGSYFLKIVEDDNLDGVWNSGSLITKSFPETIYTHSKEIIIRANWELEETINLKTR